MPTYEYECTKCQQPFEMFQSMRDAPIKKCPKCGGKVKRLLGTGAGIIFKGKGFYQTDYRSSSYKSGASADGAASTSSTSSSSSASSTTASAPAAKSDAGSKGGESGGAGAKK